MLRVVERHGSDETVKYFDVALRTADYYVKEPGEWHGKGAEMLGLKGDVMRDDFVSLAKNQVPGPDGKKLTARVRKDRRAGYDFVYSVPKSLSLYLALNDDPAVERMIQEAFRETMSDVERRMEGRVRRHGGHEDRVTGNMVFASFTHRETRPINGIPDPHVHIHAFVFNATFDQVEGVWKAGQFGTAKRNALFYQAQFNARLADKLTASGIGIRRTDSHFELSAVAPKLVELFSRRTRQIEKFARDNYKGLGAKARDKARITGMDFADAFAIVKSEIGARTRESKSAAVLGSEDQLANWKERMSPEESASLTPQSVRSAPPENLLDADKASQLAVLHLFEHLSIARMLDAAAMLLCRGIGRVRISEAEAWAKSKVFLKLRGDMVSTQEVKDDEVAMIQVAKAGRGKHEALGSGQDWVIKDEKVLSDPGQSKCVRHLLTSRDLVMDIQGPAGAGKTDMSLEAVKAIEALSCKQVFTFTPSSGAVIVLKGKGFSKPETFKRLEISAMLQDSVKGQVIWVDEAGFLSVREMRWLLEFAEANTCRVVLSGDIKQNHAVKRGDALRILERSGAVEQVRLDKIHRQQVPALLAAVYDLSAGESEQGFDKLDQFGVIQEVEDNRERMEKIAQLRIDAIKEGKSSLIVSPVHADARAIAGVVRETMRAEGLITGPDLEITRLQRLNLTEAQRGDAITYEPGQVVEFHRLAKGAPTQKRFKSGEQWTVVDCVGGDVILDRNDKRKILPLDQAGKFEVYRPQELCVAAGETIRITKNFVASGKKYLNNEVYTVSEVRDGKVTLSDGRTLDLNLLHIDQGHVVTSHAAQGKTVDIVIASMPVNSFSQTNEAQFYVTMSRARTGMHLLTDSKVSLREAVCRTSERIAVTDMIPEIKTPEKERFVDLLPGARMPAAKLHPYWITQQPPGRNREREWDRER